MAAAPEGKSPKPGLHIYSCFAVNPYKLSIAAEELDIPYNYINIELTSEEIKSERFPAINPNGRLPALVHLKEDGTTVAVFETAACLLYLASELDKEQKLSYPYGTQEYWTQVSWLSWQVSSQAPILVQAVHFLRYAAEPVPYASKRMVAEPRRLHYVLNKHLYIHPFVAGDILTIADVAIFIFVHSSRWDGLDINQSPHLKAWHDKLLERPAFQRGLQVPMPYAFSDEAVMSLKNQEFDKTLRKTGSRWVQEQPAQWAGEALSVPSDYANLEL